VIADYDGSNALQHRYVFAPGIDQPIVQYDASGNRAFLGSDERGSIVSLTDSSGNLINLNRYDEYGKPQSTNSGRFQYTGQMWLSEIGAYYYKARVYLPHLGIFAQTDPIGTDGGMNLYAYTGSDPVNGTDPLGTFTGSNIPGKGAVGTPNGCTGDCSGPSFARSSRPANQTGFQTDPNDPNGGTLNGGPESGQPIAGCDCILPSDPGAGWSKTYWGGAYDSSGNWVSNTDAGGGIQLAQNFFANDNVLACRAQLQSCRSSVRNPLDGGFESLRQCFIQYRACNDAASLPPNDPNRTTLFIDRATGSVVVVPKSGPPIYYPPGTYPGLGGR
jgi:RHS repeat-associated protein